MINLLGAKPQSYYQTSGLPRMIMNYVHPEDVRDKRVLDVGCGIGSFLLSALEWDPAEAVGIDVNAADVTTAAAHVQDPRARFEVASALELPFPDDHFDTVTSWEVLEHIPRKTEARYFAEIYRVLKPGGRFYLSTPHQTLLSCVGDPAWWLVGHRHYSKTEIARLALDARFTLDDLALQGGVYAILQANNMYVAKWIFRREPFFESFFNRKLCEEFRLNNASAFMGIRASFTKA